jgi:hypothetical protein
MCKEIMQLLQVYLIVNTIGQCEDMVLKMQCFFSWLNMEALLGLKGGGFINLLYLDLSC